MTTTNMTEAQRQRKVAAATRRMIEARDLLAQACDDYAEQSYRLTTAEHEAWRAAVALCAPLERLLQNHA
jgi:hypothetical protein